VIKTANQEDVEKPRWLELWSKVLANGTDAADMEVIEK